MPGVRHDTSLDFSKLIPALRASPIIPPAVSVAGCVSGSSEHAGKARRLRRSGLTIRFVPGVPDATLGYYGPSADGLNPALSGVIFADHALPVKDARPERQDAVRGAPEGCP